VILGVFNIIKKWKKLENKEKILINLLIIISILTIITYLLNSLKDPRYLFNLTFPAVYFSFFGVRLMVENIKNEKVSQILKLVFILFFLILAISTFFITQERTKGINRELEQTKQIIYKIENNCTVSSDLWVYFDWQNRKAVTPPWALYVSGVLNSSENKTESKPQIFQMNEEGYNIILFKRYEAFAKNKQFVYELNSSIIEDNEDYVWLYNSSTCKQTDKINLTYIDSLRPVGEFSQDFSGCDALMTKLKLRKICQIFKFL
jgi:hypothetical protein